MNDQELTFLNYNLGFFGLVAGAKFVYDLVKLWKLIKIQNSFKTNQIVDLEKEYPEKNSKEV